MKILNDAPLSRYSTMRLGGPAAHLAEITDVQQIPEAVAWARGHGLPLLALGEGANVVFRDDGYPGLVLLIRNKGIDILEEDDRSVTIRAAAGEKWDDLVDFSVDRGLSGIEALTAVPGTVGGAPVQNVGCYGQELSDTFQRLEAYDLERDKFVTLDKRTCGFRYRDSIFKSTHPDNQKGRYVITSVTLKLSRRPTLRRPLYESLQRFMDSKGMTDIGPKSIRTALLEWRGIYLPDPSVIPSNGSFFRNPIVPESKFKELEREYPQIKGWPLDNSKPHHRDYENHGGPMVKLAAAWLVDKATEGQDLSSKLRLHDRQKIVITNPDGASYAELEVFVRKITGLVQAKFGIRLEPEPETLP
ncbi:MAG TPA: UDP-N-acetylmuramate dehydrogenase [Candidatus Saccharimonadales bacterium]|nr:UDP-N-acetylmuramate dehydrogenase [Candidatus Saccharimonadales bacterium]